MIKTVEAMTKNGVQFRHPPPTYYTEVGWLKLWLSIVLFLIMHTIFFLVDSTFLFLATFPDISLLFLAFSVVLLVS